jgi:hypothetical protein
VQLRVATGVLIHRTLEVRGSRPLSSTTPKSFASARGSFRFRLVGRNPRSEGANGALRIIDAADCRGGHEQCRDANDDHHTDHHRSGHTSADGRPLDLPSSVGRIGGTLRFLDRDAFAGGEAVEDDLRGPIAILVQDVVTVSGASPTGFARHSVASCRGACGDHAHEE